MDATQQNSDAYGGLNLFTLAEVEATAQAAIDRATENAAPDWKAEALQAVIRASRELDEFTTDEIVARIPKGVTTHEGRALGGILQRACREGYIAPTGQYRQSLQLTCHGRPKAIWRSLGRIG